MGIVVDPEQVGVQPAPPPGSPQLQLEDEVVTWILD
jgi:hypothetical protein